MELWWPLIFYTLLVSAGLSLLLSHRRRRGKAGSTPPLPPGPLSIPIIGSLTWFNSLSVTGTERGLRRHLIPRYGPIVSLRFGSRVAVFISDGALAHEALIQHGAAVADRPPVPAAVRFFTSDQHTVARAPYGPLWRALRRNLSSEILHPSRYTKLYSSGRRWVLNLLVDALRAEAGSNSGGVVVAYNHFHSAVLSLLSLMCFGERFEKGTVVEIETAQRQRQLHQRKLVVFAFAPRITGLLFRRRLRAAVDQQEAQRKLFLRLIQSRGSERMPSSYVDSLLELNLPEEEEGGRKLTDEEIATLCSEFLTGGTHTTAAALQWIMAELVNHQEIQRRVFDEITETLGSERGAVEEEDVQRMPYLRAVVMEGLRLHPPAHFLVPHAVSEDVVVGGYLVPKGATLNFVVGEMNWDGRTWRDPMEFRPERFLEGGEGEGVDIAGIKGGAIRMLPFGAGRRVCPGLALAMLHLEYLVGNLVKESHWAPAVDGEEVDLSEKTEFITVMKKPLRARIVPRNN